METSLLSEAANKKQVTQAESLLEGKTEELTFKVGNLGGAGNDRVADKDQLGFKHYVAAFADLIESTYTKPPLTIGIFGSWGMGKSFLLDHIARTLNQRYQERKTRSRKQILTPLPRVHIVEFNAWEYSCSEIIWPGLVRKIMNRLEKEVSWGFPGRFLIKFSRNLKHQLQQSRSQVIAILAVFAGLIVFSLWKFKFDLTLIWSASLALGAGGLFKLIADTASKPLSQWVTNIFQNNTYGKHIGYMAEIRADLEFLAKRLKNDNGRILVIIDDLDRCEPQKAVEVLQAIKLLLNFDSFIVCLGIDARIITRAVEEHYKNMLGPAGASGYEYLDKIVQIPFRIPQPNTQEIKSFIARQLFPDEKYEPKSSASEELLQEILEQPGLTAEPNANDSSQHMSERVDQSSGKVLSADAEVNVINVQAMLDFLREQITGKPIELEVAANGKKLKIKARNREELNFALQAAQEFQAREQIQLEPQEISSDSLEFTYDELQAFQNLARFLRPNPRHLKRLVNVYRLVRSLAKYSQEDLILRNPITTVNWLVMCGQWPYTTYAMLCYFDEMLERKEEESTEFPEIDNPLKYLLERVTSQLSEEKQSKLDHDLDLLRSLVNSQNGRLNWNDLEKLRKYTVNFNPAIEAELKSEILVKLIED